MVQPDQPEITLERLCRKYANWMLDN